MNNKQLLIHGGVLVAGAGIGFGAGYLVFKKKYQAIADVEIESVKEAYSKSAKLKPELRDIVVKSTKADLTPLEDKPEVLTEDEAIIYNNGYSQISEDTDADVFRRSLGRVPTSDELALMGQGMSIEDVSSLQDASDVAERNIFDDPPEQDPEDLGEGVQELPPRSLDRPYVIETAEWYLNETDYDQVTLTYWADDDVLADDAERMVNEVEEVVGATNLHRFGFKSDNPDIVYVRNDRLKVDYEITKDERGFAEVVHGMRSNDQ